MLQKCCCKSNAVIILVNIWQVFACSYWLIDSLGNFFTCIQKFCEDWHHVHKAWNFKTLSHRLLIIVILLLVPSLLFLTRCPVVYAHIKSGWNTGAFFMRRVVKLLYSVAWEWGLCPLRQKAGMCACGQGQWPLWKRNPSSLQRSPRPDEEVCIDDTHCLSLFNTHTQRLL